MEGIPVSHVEREVDVRCGPGDRRSIYMVKNQVACGGSNNKVIDPEFSSGLCDVSVDVADDRLNSVGCV